MRCRLVAIPLAALLILVPALHARATTPYGTYSMGGFSFDVGTNGCLGPVVGVYGDSALKNYILQTAEDYCDYQLANGMPPDGASDVEWKDGGDSCPGVYWAETTSDDNELGVSTGVPGTCYYDLAYVADHKLGVDVVDLLMQCSQANTPQGGAPASEIPLANQTPCAGSGSGASLNFPAPNNLSVPSAGLALKNTASNWSQVGGQSVTAQAQQRITGSGTRITECYNIFGPGADASCLNNTAAGAAQTSGAMENDICGPVGGSPVDPVGAIGYTSRATILQSVQTNAPANTPVSNCGIVNQGGGSGWNGTCDAAQTPNNTPGAIYRGGGNYICPGDNEVANGNYVVWGYAHAYLNPTAVANGANAEAQAYVSFLQDQNDDTATVRANGLLQVCEMNVGRGFDGGPYSLATSSC